MTEIAQRMTPRLWALLVALSLLWGGSFLFIGIAVRELPPITVVWIRVVLAAVALWAFAAASGRPLPRWSAWRVYLAMGALNNVIPFGLIAWGQTEIASGLAAILNAMTPVFTVLVAHALTADERLSGAKAVGVGVAFAGWSGPTRSRASGRRSSPSSLSSPRPSPMHLPVSMAAGSGGWASIRSLPRRAR